MILETVRIRAPELDGGRAWLNCDGPLRLADLRGHVVVLDFWTYGCINCIHMVPALAEVERRFAGAPVVVIGVHAAKFLAEEVVDQVRAAIARLGITHPVVVDDERRLWSRYAVKAWPTTVVVRPDGTMAATARGEVTAQALIAVIDAELERAAAASTLAARPVAPTPRPAPPGALLAYPGKVITDERGALWIADSGHHRVLGADAGGRVHTIIGSGERGHRDGALADAQFHDPQGLALGGQILYVADARAHAVRRVDLDAGVVTTIAGTGERGLRPDAPGAVLPARDAALRSPWDLALDPDAGHLYVALAGSHQIGRLDVHAGVFTILAGTGAEALVDGPFHQAVLAQPSGLALSPDRRRLYVADCESSAVRVLDLAKGRVDTLAGAGLFAFGHEDGPRERARLQHCMGLAVSPGGLAVADTYNHAVRGLNLRHLTLVTLWRESDAPGLSEPAGIAFDRTDRSYVVADTGHHRLVRVARDAAWARVIELRTS